MAVSIMNLICALVSQLRETQVKYEFDTRIGVTVT